jgi:hypothetical protein
VFIVWGLVAGHSSAENPSVASCADAESDEPTPAALSFRALWQKARKNPELVAWLFGATLCSLMDETLVAFCAVWMRERFGSDSAVSIGVFALMLGGFAGLLILHRLLLTVAPGRLLLALCLGAMLALVAWLAAGSLALAVLALGVLGACAATHYPLAQAAAYRALPGEPSSVAALGQLRKTHSALRRGKRAIVSATDNTFVYSMSDGTETLYIAINRGDSDETVSGLPAQSMQDLLNQSSVSGPSVLIPARSSRVLKAN